MSSTALPAESKLLQRAIRAIENPDVHRAIGSIVQQQIDLNSGLDPALARVAATASISQAIEEAILGLASQPSLSVDEDSSGDPPLEIQVYEPLVVGGETFDPILPNSPLLEVAPEDWGMEEALYGCSVDDVQFILNDDYDVLFCVESGRFYAVEDDLLTECSKSGSISAKAAKFHSVDEIAREVDADAAD